MFKRIVVVLFLVVSLKSAFAQRPDWEKVDITYLQLPLMPVTPMAEKYFMQVYSNPNSNSNAVGYKPIDRSVETVASQLHITGCKVVTDTTPDFTVLVMMGGFQITGSTIETYSTVVNGTTKYQYYYRISYGHRVTVQIIDALGAKVRDYTVTNTDQTLTRTSQYFNSTIDANNWWYSTFNNRSFLQACDNEAYQNAITNTQKQLNSELGYLVRTIYIEVAGMKEKPEYKDLNDAFADAAMGYNLLSSNRERAFDYILKAVAVWEKALLESNMTNKKARINANVTESLYQNLAVGYCFLEEWDLSQMNLIRLKQLKISGSMENKVKKATEFKTDYKARIVANKMR